MKTRAFQRTRARIGALVTDTLLLAYAAWCVDFLLVRARGGGGHTGWLTAPEGLLGGRPWLVLLAPLVAIAWEGTGRSLGQLGWRVRIEAPEGRAAPADVRAFRALVAAALALLALVPAALGRPGLGLLVALALAAAGLWDARGRGIADRVAGTETVVRRGGLEGAHAPWWRRPNPVFVLVLLALTLGVGAVLVELDAGELVSGAERTQYLWGRLVQPDWSITERVAERMVVTIFLALMASVLALPFAFVLSFLGARNVTGPTAVGGAIYAVTRALMNVARSIEPIVWAIIFVLWVGVGPFAGTLALFVHSIAALGKLYSEQIEVIDPGPVEAIQATGANRLQVLRFGVVPQVVPPFLSFTVYRWDINVRMATILGFVGGGGIGDLLMNYQQLGAWSKVSTILLFITLVVWVLDWTSARARERLG